jgi:hypothetical protein
MRRNPRERARKGLGEALARVGRERTREEERGPEPWPGDLFVLPETATFGVEWLVVLRERQGLCRVVAADANPLLGCADVALPAEAAIGPLSVRSAVEAVVEVASLRRGARTGTLAAEDLDRVRRRREELAAGAVADPRLGPHGEPDPEYEDWLDEVLLPARAALSPVHEEEPVPEYRGLRRAIGIALALSLLLALGGAAGLAWRFQQGERLAWREVRRLQAEHQRAREVELRQERELAQLVEANRQQLQELQATEARHLEDLRARTAPPPPAARRAPLQVLTNLAYANFYPGETRGAVRETEIALPAGTTYLVALFYVGQESPYPEYRLEVSGRASWIVPGLHALSGQEVSVALPRELLGDGDYVLHLYGVRGGESRSVGEFEVRVRSQAETHEP